MIANVSREGFATLHKTYLLGYETVERANGRYRRLEGVHLLCQVALRRSRYTYSSPIERTLH